MQSANKKLGRYYLDELNVNPHFDGYESDNRFPIWQGEQQVYGFDETDTWNLNYTMLILLYERVCMYRDKTIINTDFYDFKYKGETLTQGDIINKIIEKCEFIFTVDNFANSYDDNTEKIKQIIEKEYDEQSISLKLQTKASKYETDIWNMWNVIKEHMRW